MSTARACGKRRFATRPKALAALQAIRRTRGRDRTPAREYACPRCHGWHLTSDPA